MLYSAFRAAFWVFTHLVCRYRVRGREYVPMKGPLLIIANHLSWYDPILLGVELPRRVRYFTKSEIFRWPIVGLLGRLTGQIPVHRGAHDHEAIEKGLAYVREGKAVMIFPEGAVEKQGRMLPAHTGTALLAVRTGVPVLPIALCGTRRILRSFRIWFPKVDVEIGKPFIPLLPPDVSHKAGLQCIAEDMLTRIADMLPEEQRGFYGKAESPNT